MMKNTKGITLVALVVTIVILLILAGIAIVALTGDNGLFLRTQQAKEKTIQSRENEEDMLNDYENKIDMAISSNRETTKK